MRRAALSEARNSATIEAPPSGGERRRRRASPGTANAQICIMAMGGPEACRSPDVERAVWPIGRGRTATS
eukprot:8217289-Alexandrium_andersonii.AAC.1